MATTAPFWRLPGPAGPAPEPWTARALALAEALQRSFAVPGVAGAYREAVPAAERPYAFLWPWSQVLAAGLELIELGAGLGSPLDVGELLDPGLAAYRDDRLRPPGYASYVLRPLGGGGDAFYDDNAWIGLALVTAHRLLGDDGLRLRAEEVLAFVLSGWDHDDRHPAPGGVFWTRAPWSDDRNTVSNAPTAQLALGLHELTDHPALLAWAQTLLAWTRTHLRDPDDGLYWDHIDLRGTIERTKWSYNQGSVLGGELLLARALADADAGQAAVHREEAERLGRAILDRYRSAATPWAAQGLPFNAVCARNLLALAHETADEALARSCRDAVLAIADDAWQRCRADDDLVRKPEQPRTTELIDQAALVRLQALAGLATVEQPVRPSAQP